MSNTISKKRCHDSILILILLKEKSSSTVHDNSRYLFIVDFFDPVRNIEIEYKQEKPSRQQKSL